MLLGNATAISSFSAQSYLQEERKPTVSAESCSDHGGFWNLLLTKSKRSVANGVRQRKTHWQVRDVGLSPPLRC